VNVGGFVQVAFVAAREMRRLSKSSLETEIEKEMEERVGEVLS